MYSVTNLIIIFSKDYFQIISCNNDTTYRRLASLCFIMVTLAALTTFVVRLLPKFPLFTFKIQSTNTFTILLHNTLFCYPSKGSETNAIIHYTNTKLRSLHKEKTGKYIYSNIQVIN